MSMVDVRPLRVGDIVRCRWIGESEVYHVDDRGAYVYSELAERTLAGHNGSASRVDTPGGGCGYWNLWFKDGYVVELISRKLKFKGNS